MSIFQDKYQFHILFIFCHAFTTNDHSLFENAKAVFYCARCKNKSNRMNASAEFLHGIPSQIVLLSPVTVTRQLRKSLDAASLKFVTIWPRIG